MKKIFLALVLFGLVSCVSKRIPYEPDFTVSDENAKKLLEQVLTEQPLKYRPATTTIAPDYIELNYGMQTRSNGNSGGIIILDGIIIGSGHTTETTKELKKRIYYNSILECKVFIKGSWHVVQLMDTEMRVMHNFYCMNEIKAKRFADALMSMKKNVKNPLEK